MVSFVFWSLFTCFTVIIHLSEFCFISFFFISVTHMLFFIGVFYHVSSCHVSISVILHCHFVAECKSLHKPTHDCFHYYPNLCVVILSD